MVFKADRAVKLGIKEPSDVVALPGGGFLVVSDVEQWAMVVTRSGRGTCLQLPGAADGESGFEAVAYDAARKRLYVVREERQELVILRWAGTCTSLAKLVGVRALPGIGRSKKKRKNKGIEGMTCLPARFSPTGKAHLVLAKEAKPRAIVLLGADGEGEPTEIAVDRAIKEACTDFSGLAVDPVSGHLFVCSDESATVAEIVLHSRRKPRADLVAVTDLRDPRGRRLKRVEGIAIDKAGDLVVLLENRRELWRFARGR